MLTQDQAKQNLAVNLRRILEDRGLNALELSRRSGVPQASVYGILQRRSVPNAALLYTIAETLDVSSDRLLQAPPEPSEAEIQKIA